MSYNLFLDDVRIPYSNKGEENAFSYTLNKEYRDKKWIVVRNYDDFVKTINEKGIPLHLSLDHDLGDSSMNEWWNNTVYNGTINYNNINEKTGMDCVKFLVEYCMDNELDFPLYYLHTQNPVGKENMKTYIDNFIKRNEK